MLPQRDKVDLEKYLIGDPKVLLKKARQLIEEKNFKEAQECCKTILRLDKKNYLALVLLGKSLQDDERAVLAYQKAIDIKPDRPLAWQGIANYYELQKENHFKIKLLHVYETLLQMEIEEEQTKELILKVFQIGCLLKNEKTLSILANYILKSKNIELIQYAELKIVALLKVGIDCKEYLELVCSILSNILKKCPNVDVEFEYAKIILKKYPFPNSIQETLKLNQFSENIMLKEYVCKFICENFIKDESLFNFDIDIHINAITAGIDDYKYARLLKCIHHFIKAEYLEAYTQYYPLVQFQEINVIDITFILKCTIKLKLWSYTEKISTHFLNKTTNQSFSLLLRKYLFLSLTKEKKCAKAIKVLENTPLELLNESEKALLAECLVEVNKPADHIIENLQSIKYITHLHVLVLLKQNKYSEVVNLLKDLEGDYSSFFYLGKAYFYLQKYDDSLINLTKSAELNSEHAETFLYLGHCYYIKENYETAQKYYEMAYNLNENDIDIIRGLSDTCNKLGLIKYDFELLKSVVESNDLNFSWIYFRLGLHYLNKQDYENAVVNLRKVVRSNEKDAIAIECLADSYYYIGSYRASLDAYVAAIKLKGINEATNCVTKVGYIQALRFQYDKAVTTFDKVLKIKPNCPLTLKGIAESWLKIAKQRVKNHRFGSARDCAQKALEYISNGLLLRQKYTYLIKILPDTCMFVYDLPKQYAYLNIRKSFNNSLKEGNVVQKLESVDLIKKAINYYTYVARLKKHETSYDLALAYFTLYKETKSPTYWNLSYKFTLTCFKLTGKKVPFYRHTWNLLGKLWASVNEDEIAFHCFKKALALTPGDIPDIWCNLGVLLMKNKKYIPANHCFFRGQSANPRHPESWIGQGLLAEILREEEAMDLFRQADFLGYHRLSAIAYSYWVCHTIRDCNYKNDPYTKFSIDELYARQRVTDLLTWYTSDDRNSAFAFTTFGNINEMCGKLQSAYKCYEKALQLGGENNKNILLLNMGGVLNLMGRFDEAINVYNSVTDASLDSTVGLALALFKKRMYVDSYLAYMTAFRWLCTSKFDKSDILIAMAGIMYTLNNVHKAKYILFQSIQLLPKKPSARSLLALCSLGHLYTDQGLYKLALSELNKYEEDEVMYDIAYLKTTRCVEHTYFNSVISPMMASADKKVRALLFILTAQTCIDRFEEDLNLYFDFYCKCYSVTLDLYDCNHGDICVPSTTMALGSIAGNVLGKRDTALILSRRGFHVYPYKAEVWVSLLFFLVTNGCYDNEKTKWLIAAARYMFKNFKMDRLQRQWVKDVTRKLKANC